MASILEHYCIALLTLPDCGTSAGNPTSPYHTDVTVVSYRISLLRVGSRIRGHHQPPATIPGKHSSHDTTSPSSHQPLFHLNSQHHHHNVNLVPLRPYKPQHSLPLRLRRPLVPRNPLPLLLAFLTKHNQHWILDEWQQTNTRG